MTAPHASPQQSRWSLRVISIRLSPSAPCHRQRCGRRGGRRGGRLRRRHGEASREREAAEGKGETVGVREVEPCSLHLLRVSSSFPWEVPPAMSLLAREGWRCPSQSGKQQDSTSGMCFEVHQNTTKLRISFALRQWRRKGHGPPEERSPPALALLGRSGLCGTEGKPNFAPF